MILKGFSKINFPFWKECGWVQNIGRRLSPENCSGLPDFPRWSSSWCPSSSSPSATAQYSDTSRYVNQFRVEWKMFLCPYNQTWFLVFFSLFFYCTVSFWKHLNIANHYDCILIFSPTPKSYWNPKNYI